MNQLEPIEAIAQRLGQGRGGTAGRRSAGRVSRYRRFFLIQPLAHEGLFRSLQGSRKTRTTGARNWLEPQSGYSRTLQGPPGAGILPAYDPQIRLVQERADSPEKGQLPSPQDITRLLEDL
jgi:hypothetical protein